MNTVKSWVLVVDDEETIRKLLKSRLEREGFSVEVAGTADEAESVLSKGGEYSVMVTDLKMPGRDGFALIESVKTRWPGMKSVVITGHGEKAVAIEALRKGASDYLEKPFDLDELSHAVKRASREYFLEKESQERVNRLQARVERVEGKQEDEFWYVSRSQAMEAANQWLAVLRRESMRGEVEEPTVLILGESGTGKEGIARMVHAGSRRGKGPWVAVNCANFSEQLLESELFGHERGAFTGAVGMKRGLFEIAKGGTLFLDEIGEMDIKLQAKLLRVLQEKTFRRVGGTQDIDADVRVVAATNRNLDERVKASAFREDLYHRLNRVILDLPALRERREDVVDMAMQFAERAFRQRAKTFKGFTPDAQECLRNYSWPGNVRELLNVVERTALVFDGHGTIGVKDLGLPQSGSAVVGDKDVSSRPESFELGPEDGFMELKRRWSDEFEREYLTYSLTRHQGNVSAAAREAKIDRSNFLRLLRRHGIKAAQFRAAGSPTLIDISESEAA